MGEPDGFQQTRFGLRDGMELAGADWQDLWWRYVALGGSSDPVSTAMRVLGAQPCDGYEHNLIAQALNEMFIDRGQRTFPVGYAGPAAAAAAAPGRARCPARPSRAVEAARRAAAARMRSGQAAHRAAVLHARSAQLMRTSGQLRHAQRAEARAHAARRRSDRAVAA